MLLVTTGKFLKFSMPQFFHFYNRNNNTPIAVLWGIRSYTLENTQDNAWHRLGAKCVFDLIVITPSLLRRGSSGWRSIVHFQNGSLSNYIKISEKNKVCRGNTSSLEKEYKFEYLKWVNKKRNKNKQLKHHKYGKKTWDPNKVKQCPKICNRKNM